jgi:hypothetical protein
MRNMRNPGTQTERQTRRYRDGLHHPLAIQCHFSGKQGRDPGGQRSPALLRVQTRGHDKQTRDQKIKGDLFILDEKSGTGNISLHNRGLLIRKNGMNF